MCLGSDRSEAEVQILCRKPGGEISMGVGQRRQVGGPPRVFNGRSVGRCTEATK